MKEAVLHIGYPKSGSSALQTTLSASRANLAEQGFFYPDAPRGLCNALTAQFHHAPEALYPYCDLTGDDAARRAAIAADFGELTDRIDRGDERCFVLSSESLFDLDALAIARLHAWMSARFDRTTIVCYARHPIRYASSIVQERVKLGQSLREVAGLFAGGTFRSHTVLLEAWADAFGRDAMVVRAFEREQLVNGDIVDDFARTIGYSGEFDRSRQFNNPGLSFGATWLMSAINDLPRGQRQRARAHRWIRRIPGPAFTLPSEELRALAVRCAPHLVYLAATWGVRFGPSAEIPEPPGTVFGEEELAFIARRLARATPAPADR